MNIEDCMDVLIQELEEYTNEKMRIITTGIYSNNKNITTKRKTGIIKLRKQKNGKKNNNIDFLLDINCKIFLEEWLVCWEKTNGLLF